MSRVLTAMPAVVLALAVLAGCGQEPTPGAPSAEKAPATADSHAKRRQMEAMRADCMKGKGFKYIPNVSPDKIRKGRLMELSGDYEAMHEYREKHGFGVYFAWAYPDDPDEGIPKTLPDPNMKLAESFSEAQYEAWDAADNACLATVFKKLTGKTIASRDDLYEQAENLYIKARERELDGDARLVELARGFGDCLKSKGYPVNSLKPTALQTNVRDRFEKERTEAQKKRMESGAMEKPGGLRMPPNEARPRLAKEIKAALDDLECGKDFYAEFLPRDMKLRDKAWNEFGQKDGLIP
ncbi:hypothetical protein [Streptosporangium sp. NPDC000396]|uniref:hypothetical protein n=1 Tax=Streptosporangium sp. NPDC000396 TaxID=3366185 RepID=UPI0036B75A75